MSTTEDRLIAALAARADQVQPEDLRAPEVPAAPPAVTFLRRPAAFAVGIAAAAAAIAAPFVIGGLGSGDNPAPPATSSPSPTLAPQPDVGGDWPVIDRGRADLDGDGAAEQIRLRAEPAEPGEPLIGPRVRVEADLSTGEPAYGIVDSGDVGVNLMEPIVAGSDGGQEVTINRDDADGLSTDWLVIDLVDGQLVELERSDEAPLETNSLPDPEEEGREYVVDRWIEDGTLYSARSTNSFVAYGLSLELPQSYVVDVWSWHVDGRRLVPQREEPLCLRAAQTPQEGQACAAGAVDSAPPFLPEEDQLISVGESFTTDVDFDQVDDTISLEGPAPGVDNQVGDGEVELVVRTSTNGVKRLQVPAGGAPELYATTIQIGMLDGLSLLLRQENGDSSRYTYVATGPKGFAGDLLTPQTSGAPFGNGFLEDGSSYRTWVGGDDRMYTGVEPVQDHPGRLQPTEVYVWTLDAGPELSAVALGGYCFDTVFGDVQPCD